MKDVLEDDDGVVQLGHVEIAADRLEDGGDELWVLLGPRDQLEVQVPDEHLAMLPDHGWRLVHELELPHGHQRAFAAPRPDGGWALVNAFDRGTDSIVSADPGPPFVVPGAGGATGAAAARLARADHHGVWGCPRAGRTAVQHRRHPVAPGEVSIVDAHYPGPRSATPARAVRAKTSLMGPSSGSAGGRERHQRPSPRS